MSNEQPANPRLEEDWQFKQVAGPARYSRHTDGPVAYLRVADRVGIVIGYVWANDKDGAAGFVVPPGLPPSAVNAGARWVRALRDGKVRELAPTALLAELARGTNDNDVSHVVPDSLTDAPNAGVVKALAQGDQ